MLVAATAAAVCAGAANSRAEGGPQSETCAPRHATALGLVACELARGLPQAASETLVVTAAVSGELTKERRAELGGRLSALVAGELGPKAHALSGIVSSLAAHGAARGARVVLVRAELDRSRISATADVLGGAARFWERFADQASRVTAHSFAAQPLDAELRSALPRVPLVISRIHKAKLDEPAVAVACGDIDGDGSPELGVVGRHRLRIGRIVSGAFQATESAAWADLSPLSGAPLREPIAAALLRNDGTLSVGTTDRENLVVLDRELKVLARAAGRIPWSENSCARRTGLGLSADEVACSGTFPSTTAPASNAVVDAVAAARLVGRDGSSLDVRALRRQSDGHVSIRFGTRKLELAEPVGAQLALGDLDGDGQLELLSSEATQDPAADALKIRTLPENGPLAPGLTVPVPSGLQALAVCPPGPNGFSTIVAAAGDGLWVLE